MKLADNIGRAGQIDASFNYGAPLLVPICAAAAQLSIIIIIVAAVGSHNTRYILSVNLLSRRVITEI